MSGFLFKTTINIWLLISKIANIAFNQFNLESQTTTTTTTKRIRKKCDKNKNGKEKRKKNENKNGKRISNDDVAPYHTVVDFVAEIRSSYQYPVITIIILPYMDYHDVLLLKNVSPLVTATVQNNNNNDMLFFQK